MTRPAAAPRAATVARTLAVVLAVAALIDPPVITRRATRPLVSVVTRDDQPEGPLARVVRAQLATRFTVLDAAFPAAAATVVVGTDRPSHVAAMASPVFVVPAHASNAGVAIRRVVAPRRASPDARVAVTVTLESFGTRPSDSVVVELRQDGVRVASATHVAGRATTSTPSVPTRWPVTLTAIPTRLGTIPLEVRAWMAGQEDTVRHAWRMQIDSARRRVVFLEARPSWLSTFVRRAVARDPRFIVTSRTITSTNIARATGGAPASLREAATADVLVLGAPDALSAADVSALRARLQRDGGSVVVLPDHAAPSPIDALLGIGRWTVAARTEPVTMRGGAGIDTITWRGRVVGIPAQRPRDAEVLVTLRDAGGAAPVAWRQPVGRGTLLVSGAFDAWRFRDVGQSTFEATWRDLIADAAGVASDSATAWREPGSVHTAADVGVDDMAGPAFTAVRAPMATVVARDAIDRLPEVVATALRPAQTLVAWHPMRSLWWIAPFVLLLATDWWLRRRHGLR